MKNKMKGNCLLIIPFATCCALPFWPLPLQNIFSQSMWQHDFRVWVFLISVALLIIHFALILLKKYPASLAWSVVFSILSIAIIFASIRQFEGRPFAEFLDVAATIMLVLYYLYEAFAKEKRFYETTSTNIRKKIDGGYYKKATQDIDKWNQKQKSYCITSVIFSTLVLLCILFLRGTAMILLSNGCVILLILGEVDVGDWILIEKQKVIR